MRKAKGVVIVDIQKVYAIIVGVLLALAGVIGFVNNPIFGLFGVNTAQNIVHLVGGAMGIWLGIKGRGKAYNMWLGISSTIVAILGFIPLTANLMLSIFGMNIAITVLHAAIAIASLGVAYGIREGTAQ